MARILLWNIDKGQRDGIIQQLVHQEKIDILLLVEFEPGKSGSQLSTLLLTEGLSRRNQSEKFGVFGRHAHGLNQVSVPFSLGNRVEVWDWMPPSGIPARFALVHGLDRIHNDDGTRRVFFRRLVDFIELCETNAHRRTIVVGDFNANPYEGSVVSSDGLHAIGVRRVQSTTDRHIRWGNKRESFFYNPMWRLFGQQSNMDAGMSTHFWQNSLAGDVFWHMLDQVVIRPEECTNFPEDRIRIPTSVGKVTLIAPDGTPDRTIGSDHLPILFHWNV